MNELTDSQKYLAARRQVVRLLAHAADMLNVADDLQAARPNDRFRSVGMEQLALHLEPQRIGHILGLGR